MLPSLLFTLSQLQPRLYITPDSANTGLGDVLTHTVTLTEPIISVTGSPFVTLKLTSRDARVTIAPTEITWDDTDQFTPKPFVITVSSRDLGPAYDDVVVAHLESNSELFQGFVPALTVNLQTSQPPYSPPPPTTPPPPLLPSPNHPPIAPSSPPLQLTEPGWAALRTLAPVILFMLLAGVAFFMWTSHSSTMSSKYPKRIGTEQAPPSASGA